MKQKAAKKKYEIKILKESFFFKSFNLAKSNPGKTGLIILFDVLFLVSVFMLQYFANYLASQLSLPATTASFVTFIIFTLVYYLLVLLLYSFFKYSVLDFIKSLFENTRFSFARLGEFYAVNIIIAAVFFGIMMLFNYLLASIKQQYAPFVFILLATPYLILLYLVANISHSFFYEGATIKQTIVKGFKATFTKMKQYRETIAAMIFFALMLWLLFLGAGYLIRITTSNNYSMYLTAYAYFKNISIVIFDIVIYFVIFINRISFYQVIRQEKAIK